MLRIVLPARLDSTRLPRKMLARIGTEPVIRHAVQRALEALDRSKLRGEIVVATDSGEISAAVVDLVDVVTTSAECRSGTDRAAAAADINGWDDADVIVDVQPDMPLIDPDHLVRFFRAAAGAGVWEMLTAYTDVGLVELLPEGFTRCRIASHIGLYAWRREALRRFAALPTSPSELAQKLEQLRAVEHGFRIAYIALPAMPMEVNTPEDLRQMQHFAECLS